MSYDVLGEDEWEAVDRTWDLIQRGEIDRARNDTDELLKRRPRHPDLLVLDAAVALEEGQAERALQSLKGAERSADPALLFHLRGLAHYQLVRPEPARDDAERALAISPGMAEAHDLLSKVCEFLGDDEHAAGHAQTAHEIDPESFPLPLEVGEVEFDQLVEQSLLELPAGVRERLDELPVLVESLPSRELLTREQPPLPPDILGLFVGRHLMERRHDDLPDAPGAIHLFRRNLLRACASRDELAREIRVTVQHEVGHLLGLDEDDLERWGLG
jgi:predicted Zn-dependent protease with MMP-like domain